MPVCDPAIRRRGGCTVLRYHLPSGGGIMIEMNFQMLALDVPFVLAVAAGFLSFLSPCVLPLVPAYIGYLGSQAVTAEGGILSRRATFLHGLFFVVGFSAIFVALARPPAGSGACSTPTG